jgi:hypothetical protein
VRVRILDNLLDAQLAPRPDPGLSLAKDLRPLLDRLGGGRLRSLRRLLLIGRGSLRTQQRWRDEKCQRQKLTLSKMHES